MASTTIGHPQGQGDDVALCASCDRCRARKTKCDGERPCSNCASKYMKKNKLTSVAGIDPAELDCIYSPAKRRGPVPGRSGQTRKSSEISHTNNNLNFNFGNNMNGMPNNINWEMPAAASSTGGGLSGLDPVVSAGLGQLFQQISQQPQSAQTNEQLSLLQTLQQRATATGGDTTTLPEPSARRIKMDATESEAELDDTNGVPKTVTKNNHLLSYSDIEGNRLRAFYHLSVDELFQLPAIPTDDEYCAGGMGDCGCITPMEIPATHLAALNASRFAEIALGAVVHQELELGFELSNAVVHCLRECVQEPVQVTYLYEVARAYFLLGAYRAFRGDMERYFKYRRVALTYAAQLKDGPDTHKLLAAISFLDAWAYMMYNADEQLIPAVVDEPVPPVQAPTMMADSSISPEHFERLQRTEQKCGCKMTATEIACDPRNQNWFQGAPPVFLNNEAPLIARSLDGLACAVRTCCDQANSRFASMSRATEPGEDDRNPTSAMTPTTTAVLANENELCSRNILQTAGAFLRSHQTESASARFTTQGQATIVSAMSAFLEDPGESMEDAQIQSLLSVCNKAIENPLILFHAGPTYHMVTNAAILLCHLANGMYKTKVMKGRLDGVEQAIFEDVLETLVAVSRLLKIHRRKLPVKLRCHKIPRPNLHDMVFASSGHSQGSTNGGLAGEDDKALIDLGETIMCACRGCQGFVLLGCSPCVAAERAQAAQALLDAEDEMEGEALESGDLDRELDDLGAEFDLDDDALLGMISQLVANEAR